MSVPNNRAVVLRFIEEVLNRGDVEVADEIVADDFVSHGWAEDMQGREAVKAFAVGQRSQRPDWTIIIDDVIAQGDKVVVRASGNGTAVAPYRDYPPPNTPIRVPWIAIYRLLEGKIVERWAAVDNEAVFEQYRAAANSFD